MSFLLVVGGLALVGVCLVDMFTTVLAPLGGGPVMVTEPVVEAVDTLLASVARAYTGPAASAPPVPELEALRRAGIPLVGDDACRRALADDEQRRRLLRLVATSGWSWEEVRRAGTAAAGPDCSAPPPAA